MPIDDIGVLETKRHDFLIEIAHGSPKGSFFNAREVHLENIIDGEAIHK